MYGPGKEVTHVAFASPGAHELEQMQLILDTIPVVREEDKEELLRVMPSFVSSTWEVKRPLRKLLPDVNSEGNALELHPKRLGSGFNVRQGQGRFVLHPKNGMMSRIPTSSAPGNGCKKPLAVSPVFQSRCDSQEILKGRKIITSHI